MMRRIFKMADRKKISKKTLAKAFHHWYYGHLTCFSQEHMQTFGYLTSMLPIVEEMYDTKEEKQLRQRAAITAAHQKCILLASTAAAASAATVTSASESI